MKLVYDGKTKAVYALEDGNYLLKFKDDVTGEDGKFDPGANTVGLSIPGMGMACVKLTDFFFRKIEERNIPTHFVSSDLKNAAMTVRPAVQFGKGIEVICRYKAVGSFLRRYGAYAKEGQDLNSFVEITLKDDMRGDPPITKDALDLLGILTNAEYEVLKDLTVKISGIIKEELAKKGAELYDIKLEFGRVDGKVALIDEISGGNMRAYKNGKVMEPLEIAALLLG